MNTGISVKNKRPRLTGPEDNIKGVHVLVVDDVKANRDLVKVYLDMFGCSCDFAENGRQAVEKIKACQYDIVLMDLQMPEMDGLEATNIVRQEISKDLPIIALTGAVEFDREMCLSSGMTDYFNKPIDMLNLREMIAKYL